METQHDEIVRIMANKFEREGMHVKANYSSHKNETLDVIDGYVPDLTAEDRQYGGKIILEAETPDTMSSELTKRRMEILSHVVNVGSRAIVLKSAGVSSNYYDDAEFHVAILKGYGEKMKSQLELWGMEYDQIWEVNL